MKDIRYLSKALNDRNSAHSSIAKVQRDILARRKEKDEIHISAISK